MLLPLLEHYINQDPKITIVQCAVRITEAGMNEITKYIPEAEEEPSKDDQLK